MGDQKIQTSTSGRRYVDIDQVIKRRLVELDVPATAEERAAKREIIGGSLNERELRNDPTNTRL